jgi:hypothetical protein
LDSLKDGLFMIGTDGIRSIIDITKSGTEQFGFQGTDSSHGILVQEGIASNGHFNFGPLNQIDGRVQSFEFFQTSIVVE